VFPQQLRLRVFLPVATESGRPQRCQDATPPPPPPVGLVWEYRRREGEVQWQRLSLLEDESAAFTRDGYMVVEGPADIGPTRDGKGVDEPRFWLRCRLERGSYPTGVVPEIDLLRPNTVPARNLATVRDELVGTSNGRPDQVHRLRRTPVLADSLSLETQVDEDPEADKWTPKPDFLESGPDDRHYVLNPSTGEIRFGDGERGAIPVASSDILARAYRYGGGKAGNVGPD
jgi:predicted phage baseplate assembly protein